MKLILVDLNIELVRCWQSAFATFPEVEILCGNILQAAKTCVVSPANSYGFMDGGIDLEYVNYFGLQLQVKVQQAISLRPEGHLPIGASLIVATGTATIPYLIVAPTMELPGRVSFQNCYYAMVAVLQIASQHPDVLTEVYCPGLATGTGAVEPRYAAQEMAIA